MKFSVCQPHQIVVCSPPKRKRYREVKPRLSSTTIRQRITSTQTLQTRGVFKAVSCGSGIAMDQHSSQHRKQVEEGLWAALRRHLLVKRAAGVAAAGSFGLWKVPRWFCENLGRMLLRPPALIIRCHSKKCQGHEHCKQTLDAHIYQDNQARFISLLLIHRAAS